ncbi:MAG: VWA domain-containing protein [Acidobacteria bacterium]|nr:VWA domain-containing protein [Acidobacteriota bacterium]
MAFLNPLFLIGAIAAALPVLVHLVRRTRAPKRPFPSLMFLRRIEQKVVRKRKLRNLLLLALRCLALLLLALAFARPYFTNNLVTASTTSSASTVILLDTSASMRYADVFERAKTAARNIVSNAASDEHIALVSFAQSYDIVRPLKNNHAEINALLNDVKPGLAAADYLQAVQAADALLKEVKSGAKKIFLISDFQASNWNRASAQVKLAPDMKLTPVEVADARAANFAVTHIQADPVVYTQKYTGKLTAQINNFSTEIAEHLAVDFKLNDLVVERREISLDGLASESIEFTGFNVPEGNNRASIEIANDAFAFDNRNYFVIRRENQTKVLAIETASRGRSESLYLQQALLAGENNRYALTVKSAGTVSPNELNEYRVIIINDANISAALAASVKSFVERGGGLIIAAGKHTDAAEFNRTLGNLSPAELDDAAQQRNGYALMSQMKTDHPIFSPFARSGRLTSTRVYNYHRSSPKTTAEVLAALDDGSPMLIEGLAGRGKVLLLTTTLDTAWNDLPLTAMFLPLIRQMLEHLSGEQAALSYTVGQIFTAPPGEDGTLPAIENPTGGRVENALRTANNELAVNASEVGFYRLRYRDHMENVAVNVDARESDFTKLNLDDFLASLAPTADAANTPPLPTRQSAAEIEARQRLWLPLILLALLLFVAESLLARRLRIAKLVG